jgi:hypothetical protein
MKKVLFTTLFVLGFQGLFGQTINRDIILKINPLAYVIKEYNFGAEIGITPRWRATISYFNQIDFPTGLKNEITDLFDEERLFDSFGGGSIRIGSKYFLSEPRKWNQYIEPQYRYNKGKGKDSRQFFDSQSLNINQAIDFTAKSNQIAFLYGIQYQGQKKFVVDFNIGIGYASTRYFGLITSATNGYNQGRNIGATYSGIEFYLGTSLGFNINQWKMVE